ncbi:MAG TPA: alkaline phosphatase family protein [Solirubrobacterales bacterium]|nr:alkaline phosphatase family protein [Solirubrobacterales bacterium]
MKSAIAAPLRRAMAAAATLTGKRFGLLVASSVVATSAIVASAMTGTGSSGALAALIGRSLASNNTPVATTPAPGGSSPGAGSSAPAQSGSASSAGGPLASPQPTPAPAASGPVSEPAANEPAAKPAAPEPAEAGPVKHVFVISLTSPGYEQSLGAQSQMPYLSATLRPQGELLSNYSLLSEAGLPNQIAALSGQPPNASTTAGCSTYAEFPPTAKVSANGVLSGAGCIYPVETLTLADQLGVSQLTWRAYIDGMVDAAGSPANCVHPGPEEVETVLPGGYTARQNPFVYFHSLLDLGDCSADDLPLDQLTADLRKAEKTPSYSFIAPTLCNSGATGQCPAGGIEGPASADAFLSTWVPKILASPAYKADGLLIVNFAAANPPPTTPEAAPAPATDPLHVGALLLSPFLTPGSTDAAPYNPYSILRSNEDLFGLDPLGLAAAAKTKSFAPSLLKENGGD